MIRHGSAGGFTLLEVLAALLIAAVALAYLLESQIAGIRLANATRELREATLLAKAKMQELAAGIESAEAGAFEGRERWAWEARREEGKANTRIVDQSSCRLVDQWICSRSRSLRNAFSTTPRLRKNDSSLSEGYAGVHPWRETANAPQALAYLRATGQVSPSSHPLRRPDIKPSPAPRTLNTSIGKPGPASPSSSVSGISPEKATAPAAPRLQTSVALETARTERRAWIVSVVPPAMWNSSSVPTIRSKRCNVAWSLAVTAALSMKRFSPSPCPERPHRLGRKSMSSAVRPPCSRARFSAFSTASAVRGCDRCVPVATTARDDATKASSTSSSQSAISAQFSR